MPKFLTGSSSQQGGSVKPSPLFSPGGGASTPKPESSDFGKFSIDLSDPVKSIGGFVGDALGLPGKVVDFVAPATEALGEFQVGEFELGQAVENIGGTAAVPFQAVGTVIGGALGEVGKADLPFLKKEDGTAERLGDLPGIALDVLTTPGRAVERTAAGQRVEREAAIREQFADQPELLRALRDAGALIDDDLYARLEGGESVEAIADELVARGKGFSNNVTVQLANQIFLDPLNLVAPGAAKGLQAARRAGMAVRAPLVGEQIGIGRRVVGTSYNALARGLSVAGQATIDNALGHATAGVFHAIGTRSHNSIVGGLRGINAAAVAKWESAIGRGNTQIIYGSIAKQIEDDLLQGRKVIGDSPLDVARARVKGRTPKDIARDAESYLRRVAPRFEGVSPAELLTQTIAKLAAIADISPGDAARILGSKVDIETAQTVHLAYYGHVGHDMSLAVAHTSRWAAKGLDLERLALIAPDTLTVERAAELLADASKLEGAIGRYTILANHFADRVHTTDEVMEFITKLRDERALPTAMALPKTGANALPKPLGAFRAKYRDIGYDIGFAPDDLWRISAKDGKVVSADTFVAFADEVSPVTVRNPLGRFVDAMMRGITQERIVMESRQRFVAATRSAGLIAPNEARAIHRAIVGRAADRRVSPRALMVEFTSVEGIPHATVIDEVFDAVMGHERYMALMEKADPIAYVTAAFAGNWQTVGLTQKLSGQAKRIPVLGRGIVGIAEKLYPLARFTMNPLFQLQELVESPFLASLRGAFMRRPIDPTTAKALKVLAQSDEFRHIDTAGYVLNVASGEAVQRVMGRSRFGKAVARAADIRTRKDRAMLGQVFSEYGDDFRDFVEAVNPRAWRTMEAAYGTKVPSEIAERFIKERTAMASGNLDEAMTVFDAAKPALSNADAETVWQAFRDSYRTTTEQAFKTHYFATQRGWLERTVNHPYLGLYPASYMWGKIVPEFTRFLLLRPFGFRAPLVGLSALQRTQQAFVAQLATNPEFVQWLDENEDALYLVEQLIPGNPTNLPAHSPAWFRHLAADVAKGEDVDLASLGGEFEDTAGYAFGISRSARVFGEAGQDIADIAGDIAGDLFGNLDKAAREYDGMFPSALPRE